MDSKYQVADLQAVPSPALLFYEEGIRANIAAAVALAGGPERLRPHVKTHKTREIVALELAAGITKHKCATVAEAAMLASCGVADVFLAYNVVGPALPLLIDVIKTFPKTTFRLQTDDPEHAKSLARAARAAGLTLPVLIDLDVGMNRTGIEPGPAALALYESLACEDGITPGGLHAYDGHVTAGDRAEREATVDALKARLADFRGAIEARGLKVPRLIMGGTPSFPVHAARKDPLVEMSPGTMVLHDHGYASKYADLAGFRPACAVLTRVVSRPAGGHLTLDLGSKALASDSAVPIRCHLVNVPDYRIVQHNEEHLVVHTPAWERFPIGTEVYAIPNHICPTVALYPEARVVRQGRVAATWRVAARDRWPLP